jgi:hypothetical protein
MPQTSPRTTEKLKVHSISQEITLWEDVVSLQEDLNKLVIELRSSYKSSEYSEIKLLLFNNTHDNWVLYKNSKAELDAAEYIGLPNYKSIKATSLLESTKSFIKYLESIRSKQ